MPIFFTKGRAKLVALLQMKGAVSFTETLPTIHHDYFVAVKVTSFRVVTVVMAQSPATMHYQVHRIGT